MIGLFGGKYFNEGLKVGFFLTETRQVFAFHLFLYEDPKNFVLFWFSCSDLLRMSGNKMQAE